MRIALLTHARLSDADPIEQRSRARGKGRPGASCADVSPTSAGGGGLTLMLEHDPTRSDHALSPRGA